MLVDVQQLVAQLRVTVEEARSLPMSSSAVISRVDVLAQIAALEASILTTLAESGHAVTADNPLVAAHEKQAASHVVAATRERERLLSSSEEYREVQREADRVRARVEGECEALRRETDEYVDERLANLEVTLTRTLDAVSRGRERLQGRSDLDRVGDHEDDTAFPFPERG